jgi:hypothetical protein
VISKISRNNEKRYIIYNYVPLKHTIFLNGRGVGSDLCHKAFIRAFGCLTSLLQDNKKDKREGREGARKVSSITQLLLARQSQQDEVGAGN